jgi:tetratricopeptide (TPR) repeat protein
MEENLIQKAIDSALKCKWSEAVKINLFILKKDKNDIDSLNRLARACFEMGQIKKAKLTSKKALVINPKDNIALNALEKYKNCSQNKLKQVSQGNIDTSVFIEEAGKTKLTTLINLGSNKTISSLSSGDEAVLIIHVHRVTVNTVDGKYIGKITDDLSARLRSLVKEGNTYRVFIKSTSKNCLRVIIKENKKGKGLENVISFPRETSESICESFSDSNL